MYFSKSIETFYLFFQGILIFQAFVLLMVSFMAGRKDLRYYSLFLFSAAVYFFINAPQTFFGLSEERVWQSVWYDLVNTPVIIIENLFYLLFLKSFYADISNNAAAAKVFRFTLWLIPGLLLLFIALTLLKSDRQFIFYTVKMIAVVPSFMVAYTVISQRMPFARLVANGLICTILGTCATVAMIVMRNNGIDTLFTTGYPLFFIRTGLLGDMVFYLLAILQKWHHQEKQLALEKLQSQLAVEKLRNKISGELHDDIGSTVSGIALYCHLSRDQLRSGQWAKVENSLATIEQSAGEVVGKLGDLVWAIQPRHDSFKSLLTRIKQYAEEMCSAKGITFTCLENLDALKKEPGIDIRHQIYLVSKEAINNAVKYSAAEAVRFEAVFDQQVLQICIGDNGVGFEPGGAGAGNGLFNMQQRADLIGAAFCIDAQKGRGTCIRLSLAIPQ